MAGTGIQVASEGAKPRPQTGRRQRGRVFYPKGAGGPRYPEQSTRQELRGQRRAQGGPGIALNLHTFEYEPRT